MNIKTYRQKKGMTQAELARQMGKSTNTINQWESGVRQSKADLLPQLADNLGCTVDELLRPQTEAKEKNSNTGKSVAVVKMKWYEYALWFLFGYIPAYAITMLIMIVILKGCS